MSVLTQVFMQGAVNGQGLRDIKPPLEMSEGLLPYFIGAVVILGLIAASLWFYLQKRYQTLTVSEDEVIDVPLPHEVAHERLKAIETSELLARGDMEMYHTQVAHALREYISARYRIPALELTTTALLQAMSHAEIGAEYIDRVQQVLTNCDRVKFATYQPRVAEASASIVDARWIVDATKVPVS